MHYIQAQIEEIFDMSGLLAALSADFLLFEGSLEKLWYESLSFKYKWNFLLIAKWRSVHIVEEGDQKFLRVTLFSELELVLKADLFEEGYNAQRQHGKDALVSLFDGPFNVSLEQAKRTEALLFVG